MFVRTMLAALVSVGLYALAAPAPAALAAPASRATVVHMSGSGAFADFYVPNGGVTTEVFVSVGDQTSHTPPGGPTSGPMIDYLLVTEYNSTTGQTYFLAVGQSTAPGFEIDGKSLDSAYLPPTTVSVQPVDEYGNPTFPAFDITLEVSWTGIGPITYNHTTSHDRIPHVLNFTSHFSGASRDATATGSFSFVSPRTNASVELTNVPSAFAQLANSRTAYIVVQHAPFPG